MIWTYTNDHPLGAAWITSTHVIVRLGERIFALFTVGKAGHSRHATLRKAQESAGP